MLGWGLWVLLLLLLLLLFLLCCCYCFLLWFPFVVESDCNILFLKPFTMWGWTFGLAHEKKMLFFGGFPVSSSLLLFTLLWVYHFLGKVGLLKAWDRCLCVFFLMKLLMQKTRKGRKTLCFLRGNGDQGFLMY